MNFEAPLTSLVWLTSIVSVVVTFVVSYLLIRDLGDGTLWWKLSTIITCGTLAGAIIPELVKVFTSTDSAHVREVVTASREGGASLNILSGLVAGNFSAYWMGLVIVVPDGHRLRRLHAWASATCSIADDAPPVFAFGLVAFGFLGMGPVTIAVDSLRPGHRQRAVGLRALASSRRIPNIEDEIKKDFGFEPDFEKAKDFLEENDGAGNTFKATAKPVLIGTAVVGATTMIFSIIVVLTDGLDRRTCDKLSLLHPPFLLGLITGGAVIYWFTGASIQAVVDRRLPRGRVHQGEHQARGRREGVGSRTRRRSSRSARSTRRRACSTSSSTVFFSTLAFACLEPFFFIGYLISIALFGLYQAIFMANAGGAWDNAKKIVEVELKEKGTPLHAATVVGDTVGDPVQGHLVGGDEPDHQVHDPVRPARRRARDRRSPRQHERAAWRARLLR